MTTLKRTALTAAVFAAAALLSNESVSAQTLPPNKRIVPIIGSGPGSAGAQFRTSIQLHNPSGSRIAGSLLFHPFATVGSLNDPSVVYDLAPRETKSFPDIMATLGQSGFGSLDIGAGIGELPVVTVRVFDNQNPEATTAFFEEPVGPNDVLITGSRATLVAPADLTRLRFNIGVRTLDAGAKLDVTLRHADGSGVTTVSKTYQTNFLQQDSASAFVGHDIAANDNVEIVVTEGSAIVYGTSTENATNDPALQLGRALNQVEGSFGMTFPAPQLGFTTMVAAAGTGTVSRLGVATMTLNLTVNALVGTVTGDLAADIGGDTIRGTVSGTGSLPDSKNIVPFSGTLTVTGGTGRFSGASGTATISGAANLTTNSGVVSFRGSFLGAGL